MKTERRCVVCGVDIRSDPNRCTNSCCGKCHRDYCTPGGQTSPGHGLDIVEAQTDLLSAVPYPEFCCHPWKCVGKSSCQRDPNCID